LGKVREMPLMTLGLQIPPTACRLLCSRWSTGLYCVAFLWSCCSWPALLPLFIEGKSERGKSSTSSCWNGSGDFGVRTVVNVRSVGSTFSLPSTP
uniref:Uncharacterized protein n=1 Tax=Geospiza parvula TaxID=87175 RepID=A0A8U8BJB3_GEOPR